MSNHRTKKKILFIIPSLVGGGAEKVMLLLLEHLNRDRFQPQLLVFENRTDYRTELPADINLTSLNKRTRWGNLRIPIALAQAFKSIAPDLICSFLTTTNWMCLLARKIANVSTPLVISERNYLSENLTQQNWQSVHRWFIRRLYPEADSIVCISEGIKVDLVNNFRARPEQCTVIYNPIDIKRVQTLSREPVVFPWFQEDIPILISCGRLTRQKNFQLLLTAFALLLKTMPARLIIFGKGELEAELKQTAVSLNINDRIAFLGFQQNPFKYMARAQLFILSSSWEGLGNVIIEAMACGVPVIATRCPSGPDEIITDGINGRLVPKGNPDQLAEAMKQLLLDDGLRRRIAKQGLRRANDFDISQQVRNYEMLFETILEGKL
ncbi:MAG: glycosyltransferase [bacterium]|nr:glycosyltransferase [bacterium]